MSEPVYDISDDVKRDVLAGTDLVQLVGASTSLKKSGRSWKGLCPFHAEKTPSFHVHPEKGFYYCFGCGAKGDAITFVRETERLEFPEAVAYLARLAGITLPMRRSGTRVDRGKETRAAEALALAAAFFRANLDRHTAARALLEKRGLTPEEGHGFGLGAALDAWDALKTSLAPRVQEETLLDAGLLQKNPETGRVYDRFRNRLTIEIRDARGEILGFGARAFGDDQPKYLNSPETARFSKGKLLYGLDRAKEAIRREDSVLLVEGYFDRIACERAGAANAVASMGTALTPAQAEILGRHARRVLVAYDGDAPGGAAALKVLPMLLERGLDVQLVAFPAGEDPDSFLRNHGPDALRAKISEKTSLISDLLGKLGNATRFELNERARRALEIVHHCSDPGMRIQYESEIAASLSLSREEVLRLIGKKTPPAPVKPTPAPAGGRSSLDLPEQEARVLSALLSGWPGSSALAGRIPVEVFSHPAAKEILMAIKAIEGEPGALDFSRFTSHLGADAGLVAAELLLKEGNSGRETHGERGLGTIHIPLLQLKIRSLEETARGLQPEIQNAAAVGNFEGRDAAYRRKQALVEEIRRLKAELKAETARQI
ncbi:MAG TPA: DNA primase [Thermoanaerobaculia bacterium]|nr:DNA primase [Thermoanaerobaculia bacterium]